MKRKVIITVGKTHSGKSTFAKELERELANSVIIDQDNHAEFINTHYLALRPSDGPNTIKQALTDAIVEYAVTMTDRHLILCNSNRYREGRTELLRYFHDRGFESILVFFDLPDHILEERIAASRRSSKIFRKSVSFSEVLDWQTAESKNKNAIDPKEAEADHLFVIKNVDCIQSVKRKIVEISK